MSEKDTITLHLNPILKEKIREEAKKLDISMQGYVRLKLNGDL